MLLKELEICPSLFKFSQNTTVVNDKMSSAPISFLLPGYKVGILTPRGVMGKSCVCHTIPRVQHWELMRIESENKQKNRGKNGEKIIVQITIASDDTHSVCFRHLTFRRLFTKRKRAPFSKTDTAVVSSPWRHDDVIIALHHLVPSPFFIFSWENLAFSSPGLFS